jgi:hypothetical protein
MTQSGNFWIHPRMVGYMYVAYKDVVAIFIYLFIYLFILCQVCISGTFNT